MSVTLQDLTLWARCLVRALEDAGVEGDNPHIEALKIQREIRCMIDDPPRSMWRAATWVRCDTPKLRGWVADCFRLGRPERARMYEAIIALRLLAAEVCLSGASS